MSERTSGPDNLLAWLASLLDQVNSAVCACNAAGEVIIFNVEAERILSLDRRHVLGRTLADFLHQGRGPLAPLCRVLRETLEAGEQYHRQTLLLSEEYTPAILGYTTSVLYDAADDLAGAVVLFADLSEESARMSAAQHQEQLAQMTRLASLIAHEVKNPLSTVQLYAEALERHTDPEVARAAQAIRQEVDLCRTRLDTIRRGLVPDKGAEAPTPYCDLARIASHVGERERLWHSPGLSLECEVSPCYVPLDRDAAESLLTHLLRFLGSWSEPSTELELRLTCAEQTAVLTLDSTASCKSHSLTTHPLSSTAFDPALDGYAGVPPGLGLWLAKRIASRGGGTVTLTHHGGGSRIRLSLPHLDGRRLEGIRILVTDDEPTLRSVVSRVLTTQRALVVQAANGAEALEMLRRQPFDVVVTDSLMPEMDGFELIQAISASLPVLMISGTGDSRERASEHWRAGLAFLSKPFSSEELLVALSYLLWEAGK